MRAEMNCIYLSGYKANVMSQQGILEEGTHFLQKLFTMNDVAKRLRDALDE